MSDSRTGRRGSLGSALCTAVVALAAVAGPAVAQEDATGRDAPRILVTAWGGFSLREGQRTFRFADDLVTYGARASYNRRAGGRGWVQLDHFARPDFACPDGVTCNDRGILARAGLTLPFTEDDTRRGFHPRFVGGVGAGFAEEIGLSYLLGLGAAWTLHPRFAPVFELRWERVPGLTNTLMLALGLRAGLL